MDENRIIVTDSSVQIKWIKTDEEYAEKAHLLKLGALNGDLDVHVPFILWWELKNHFGRIAVPDLAKSILSQYKALKFTTHDLTATQTHLAFQIMANDKSISFYDASYHALAIDLNGIFVSCDSKYLSKTKKWGHIMHLKDLSLD